jgi:hypothetical protein
MSLSLTFFVTDSQSVSQSVILGIEPLWDYHDHILAIVKTVAILTWGIFPDGRTGVCVCVDNM